MPEAEITRKQIIVVGEVGENSFGDLTWTDKGGKEYKIPNKRRKYFDEIIIPGNAVQLNYAVYMKKEYIYSAVSVKDELSASSIEKPQEKVKPIATPLTKDEQIERAVWIKELGECLRSKEFDKNSPTGKSLRNTYYAEMSRVLGINIKEVQPAKKNRLVEEAMKLGKEIEEGG